MNKLEKANQFNPSEIGCLNQNIFGLPFNTEESDVVILPIPWDVTVSYGAGTSKAPNGIFDASFQVDLYDPFFTDGWKKGISFEEINKSWEKKCNHLRKKAEKYIDFLSEGGNLSESTEMQKLLHEINEEGSRLNDWISKKTAKLVKQNKLVIVLGGEHSVPLGYLKTLSSYYESFGILQIDAHADLRDAYEGFEFSHASIMFNALKLNNITKLVQVGIRDYCQEEKDEILNQKGRVITFFDEVISQHHFEGKSWHIQCMEIIENLPQNVYLSIDIDGLNPNLCPNTGTPVPGGLEYQQLIYLLHKLVESGRRIIGADLCEVAPGSNDWDCNVAARLLYRLSNIILKSQAPNNFQ